MATEPARDSQRRRAGSASDGGPGKVGAFSISLFLMAILMFLPPLLTLAEGQADLFGLPRVFVFLFAVWGVVVAMVYLIAERVARPGPPER
ncbi:MAG: hypothetical protein COW30_13980 [Rhodospirillales bacterium CG15_BIG_FIL_POST_REV_8_21_14_020_66_15]|nr:MAG: hypothetical protein COW30_13980 [Rhodospirillales bacterium CG15_BIG_FIL_POST_REV_8_21_14_020_66_15]